MRSTCPGRQTESPPSSCFRSVSYSGQPPASREYVSATDFRIVLKELYQFLKIGSAADNGCCRKLLSDRRPESVLIAALRIAQPPSTEILAKRKRGRGVDQSRHPGRSKA